MYVQYSQRHRLIIAEEDWNGNFLFQQIMSTFRDMNLPGRKKNLDVGC